MLRATSQLSALPRPRSGNDELMGDRLRRIPARTRTRSGACMLDTYMRTAPTLILLDGGPSQDTWAALWLAEATKARPRPTRDSASRHPCRQAAYFLPCARPPDRQFGRSQHYHRAFVTTSVRTDNMPRQRDGDKPYSRTVLTRVEFEMLTRHSASRPRTPGRIHLEDHILSPRCSPPSSTG